MVGISLNMRDDLLKMKMLSEIKIFNTIYELYLEMNPKSYK